MLPFNQSLPAFNKKPASVEDGGREIRILNFAVSVASRNKNIEDEEIEEISDFRTVFWSGGSISTGFEVYGSHGPPQMSSV